MPFDVRITEHARANLLHYFRQAELHAPLAARRWLDRFESAIETLGNHPERCAIAPENDAFDVEVRQFLFGRGRNVFRVLFTIVKREVRVVHVRRAAMDTASPEDLTD